MDSSVFDKNLSFENTPLQNLKNILSEADASMELEANKSPGPHKSQHSVLKKKKGISKKIQSISGSRKAQMIGK